MCNPEMILADKGTLAADRLAVLINNSYPGGGRMEARHVKDLISAHWPELKRLAHVVHDAARAASVNAYYYRLQNGYWPPLDEMPDYEVSG